MKIIKTKEQASYETNRYESGRDRANSGCDECPCCHSKLHVERLGVDLRPRFHFWGNREEFQVDQYECSACGCKWESDEYEYPWEYESEKSNREWREAAREASRFK